MQETMEYLDTCNLYELREAIEGYRHVLSKPSLRGTHEMTQRALDYATALLQRKMKELMVTLYNASMQIGSSVAEQRQELSALDKSLILDSVGALLSALGIADFKGTYSFEALKSDMGEV